MGVALSQTAMTSAIAGAVGAAHMATNVAAETPAIAAAGAEHSAFSNEAAAPSSVTPGATSFTTMWAPSPEVVIPPSKATRTDDGAASRRAGGSGSAGGGSGDGSKISASLADPADHHVLAYDASLHIWRRTTSLGYDADDWAFRELQKFVQGHKQAVQALAEAYIRRNRDATGLCHAGTYDQDRQIVSSLGRALGKERALTFARAVFDNVYRRRNESVQHVYDDSYRLWALDAALAELPAEIRQVANGYIRKSRIAEQRRFARKLLSRKFSIQVEGPFWISTR